MEIESLEQRKNSMNKRGQVQIGAIIGAVIGLVFLVVVGFVSINVLLDANLLTADSSFDNATDNMVANLTDGIDDVSSKIPTIFSIAVAVLLLGLIVFLVQRSRQATQAQGGTL